MKWLFVLVVALHGLIHLLGPAKAFHWTAASPLRTVIGTGAGFLWLGAALLLLATAIALVAGAWWWWVPALPGLLLSQGLIVSAWSDAKFGTLANVLLAIPLLITLLDMRASSFRARFAHDRDALLARPTAPAPLVTEADLAPLPPVVQTHLRRVGAVGRPRVRNMRVTFTAQMRSGATAPWMPATATQYEFFSPPARLFLMKASRSGIPFDVFHRYVDDSATFQVRIGGLFPMVNKSGRGITNDETVTIMNDVVVLAPAAMLDLPFTFEPVDTRSVRATFRNAGFTVTAVLTFDPAGDLVGFVSADRAHDREGGAASWSTPISGYREIDGVRVGAHGDANWIDPSGEWTYGRFQVTSIVYNIVR